MLARTADFYDREIDALLSRISVLIEPVIIIIMGVIIGFVVITVVLPMFNIFNIFV
jgi:type IV pilus assembly protein PilC